MSELAKLRAELRELRKQSVKPVSRMRKADISAELAQMRIKNDDTPAVGRMGQSRPRRLESASETIQEAKRKEFPTKIAKSETSTKKKASAPPKKMKIVEVEVTDSESDE